MTGFKMGSAVEFEEKESGWIVRSICDQDEGFVDRILFDRIRRCILYGGGTIKPAPF